MKNNNICLLDCKRNCQLFTDIIQKIKIIKYLIQIFTEMNNTGLYINRATFVKSKQGAVTDDYIIGKQLGKGAYGTVFAAKTKGTEKIRAIKQIKKSSIRNPFQFVNQIEILKKVDHPNIVNIYETYEDDINYYVVTDLCQGGELFDRLIQKGSFSEIQAREIFRQMVYAIKYCHGQKISHRDLKPENFLMLDKKSNSIKLIDFGLSFEWKVDMREELKAKGQNKLIGTSYYIAPDILKGDYCQNCDIWSLGVILYILVTAVPPFDGDNDRKILQSVKRGIYTFDIPQMKKISSELKDLISKILQSEDKRYTIDQILHHPWMTSNLNRIDLKLNFSRMKKFSRQSNLKKYAVSCVTSQMTGKEIQQLGQLFKSIDTNMDGFISTVQLKSALQRQKEVSSFHEVEQLVKFVDLDKNGKINYHEFLACCLQSSMVLRQQNLKYVFQTLDTDHDGKISANELRCGFKIESYQVDEQSINQILKYCDKNGDGKIDFKEFMNAICEI